MKQENYEFVVDRKKHISFEDLIIYKAEQKNKDEKDVGKEIKDKINKDEAQKLYENKTYLSKGKRGLISFSIDKKTGIKYCIKEKNPQSDATNRIFLEYENNKRLNEINVGPKIYYYDEEQDFLVRDFIEGETIFDFIDKNKSENNLKENNENSNKIKNKIKPIILNILDQCRRMDKLGINKLEMTNPHKDIIIQDKTINGKQTLTPFIIDFERCKFAARTKNVTQFCQFLTKGNMKLELEKLNISFDKEKIMLLTETYKKEQTDKNYDKIKDEITSELN